MLISLAGFFLTIGLLIFSFVLAWDVQRILDHIMHNRPEEYRDQPNEIAIITVIAMSFVLVAVVLFIQKGIQRIIRPYFGPANYTMDGASIFGAGAICYLLLNIKHIDGVAENSPNKHFHPIDKSAQFDGFLFAFGAWILLLAVSRSFYCLEHVICGSDRC